MYYKVNRPIVRENGQGAEPVVVDVYEREHLFSAIRAARPDAIVHQMTGLQNGDYKANAKIRTVGSRNLIDAAFASGIKRVVAQSYCIYAPGNGLASEEDPLDLDSTWRTSAEAIQELEHTVSEVPESVVLRYGSLYGPGTGFAPGGSIAEQVRLGKFPATDDVTSFVHVEDAARAVLSGLKWPSVVVNIVDDEPAPGTEWLPVYASAIGGPRPVIGPKSNRPQRGASNRRARKELAWQPL